MHRTASPCVLALFLSWGASTAAADPRALARPDAPGVFSIEGVLDEPYRLRLDPPAPGWLVFGPDEVAASHPGARLAAVSPTGTTATVAVSPAGAGPELLATRLRAVARTFAGGGVRARASIHGVAAEVVAGEPLGIPGLRCMAAFVVRTGLLYEIAACAETDAPGPDTVLDGLRFLDGAPWPAAAPPRPPLPADDVYRPDRAVRRGLYVDFERGVLWRVPPGGWSVVPGPVGPATPGVVIFVARDARGLTLRVSLAPPSDERTPPGKTTEVGGRTAAVATMARSGERGRCKRMNIPYGAGALEASFCGTRKALRKGGADIAAAVAGLHLTPAGLASVARRERVLSDLRFGWTIDLPGDESWRTRPLPVLGDTDGALAGGASLSSADAALHVIALRAAAPLDDVGAWKTILHEMRTHLGSALARTARAERTTVAGLPARHLHLEDKAGARDLVVLVRGRMCYALLVVSRPGDPRASARVDELAAHFRLDGGLGARAPSPSPPRSRRR